MREIIKLRRRHKVGSSEWTEDAIRVLLILMLKRKFPFEREIRLYELQAWIYLPYADFFDSPDVTAETAQVLRIYKVAPAYRVEEKKNPKRRAEGISTLLRY